MNHNEHSDNRFQYTYSAKEQAELRRIREKYIGEERQTAPDKMQQLRALDARSTNRASVAALILGILSTLVMGCGMSLIMAPELRAAFSMLGGALMPVGICIGLVGVVGVILAYPLYQKVLSHERKKVAPEILRLTEELMDEKS